MIKKIKNEKKPVQYLINTNLRDIIVLVQEKRGIEWFDKMKQKFMIVDDYPSVDSVDGLGKIDVDEQEINGEIVKLITVEDFSLDKMLDYVNTKFRDDREIEEYINSNLKGKKSISFPDEEADEVDKLLEEDILDLRT